MEIVLGQLPGREARIADPGATRMEPLIESLAAAIRPHLGVPFAFYGHSMGGLIGFELARRLRAEGLPGPRHLFVSAHRAPQVPYPRGPIHHLPPHELIREMADLGGTPEAVLQNPELLELLLPTMRSDVELCETYRFVPAAPLPCGATIYGGRDDVHVPLVHLEAWRERVLGPFTVRMFPGNHFFVQTEPSFVAQFSADLRALLADGA